MNEKTVLVTGSSRGIGKAIALEFARLGCNVAINCNKDIGRLNIFLEELLEEGYSAAAIPGDISIYEQAKALFAAVEKSFGGVDILINNAGISHFGLFNTEGPEVWEKVMRANFYSALNCAHLALPYMIDKKDGVIINISSIWGDRGASCEALYSASKGALNTFTKALAKELAPSNIRVNALALGVMDTDMNAHLTPEEKDELLSQIPLGCFGTAMEAAQMAVSMAQNTYLTGQIITLDGGF